MFPEKFSSPPSPSVFEVDSLYQGWNVNVDRLFFANGLRMHHIFAPLLLIRAHDVHYR